MRQLRNKRGFAFTAVLTLALGIAAKVTIFSAVNGLAEWQLIAEGKTL